MRSTTASGSTDSLRVGGLGSVRRGRPRRCAGVPYFGAVGGRDRSLLGPDGAGDDDQNWGVDTRFVRSDVNNLAVVPPIGPNATFDLMGYCWIAAPQDIWPSDHTWGLSKTGLDDRFGATVSSLAATTTGEHLVFTGRIDVGTDVATIGSPALVSGELPAPRRGEYELRLLDDGGVRTGGGAVRSESDSGRTGHRVRRRSSLPNSMFVVPVLRPASAVARVQVWHGGTMVGRDRRVAERANRGHDGAGRRVDAVGPDRPLRMDGLRRRRRPAHLPRPLQPRRWHVVGDAGRRVRRHVVSTSRGPASPGGVGAIFQVQASDGLNLSSADSPPFTVEGSGPMVDIASPVDGETFYSGVQQVLLEATATDNEDGDVGASIVWTSDLDGQVFAGPNGSVGADTLSEGVHVLTATATDADGSTGYGLGAHRGLPGGAAADTDDGPDRHPARLVGQPVGVGQPVTFTATVSSSEPGTPTGTVSFADGTVPLGSAPVAGGTASLTTSSLGTGIHPVTAAYGGDASFDASTSDVLVQTVNRAATTIVADPLINLRRPVRPFRPAPGHADQVRSRRAGGGRNPAVHDRPPSRVPGDHRRERRGHLPGLLGEPARRHLQRWVHRPLRREH